MTFSRLHHTATLAFKRLAYGRKGEPYRIGTHTLRYLPGSRPVRLAYIDSTDDSARYDALQVDAFYKGIRPGDTVLDVGTHYGQYALLMSAFAGSTGTVVAFEPDPYARAMLERNVALNPKLPPPRIEAIALSDSAGEATLYSRGGNSQSSLARSGVEFTAADHSEAVTVRTETLDGYIQRAGLATPAWVKIDAEGAEVRILRGATRMLAGPASVICELHPYAWPEFGNTLAELQEIVSSSGRRMHYLGTDEAVTEPARYGTVVLARG